MWRVYYHDGSVFCSKRAEAGQSPPGFGAVFIRQDRADGVSMIVSGEHSSEKGYFAMVDGEWKAVDARGLCSLACNRKGSLGHAIEGTWMTTDSFRSLRRKVEADPDFGTTFVHGEG